VSSDPDLQGPRITDTHH